MMPAQISKVFIAGGPIVHGKTNIKPQNGLDDLCRILLHVQVHMEIYITGSWCTTC